MQEYKKEIYRNYSTNFTQRIADLSDRNIKKYISGLKAQYDPIIKKYNKDAAIIDLGCGSGNLLEYLKTEGFNNINGIDYSDEEIEIAISRGFEVSRASIIEYLRDTDKKFDIVFMHNVIEHFEKSEVIEICSLVGKLLNSGGVFIVHTPNGVGINAAKLIYGDLTHSTILTPNSAKQLFFNTGFQEVEFYETEPFAKDIIGMVRLIIWKLIKVVTNFKIWIETGGREKYLTRNFVAAGFKGS